MPVKEPRPTKELVLSQSSATITNNTKGMMEFQCTLCSLQLDLPSYFTHSKEVHGVFSCLYCLRCFKFSKELMVHLTREHKVTPQKFSSGAEFLDRGGTDTTLLCVECNKVFQSEALITFMKYHIHECRKSTGICPKCGSIHPLNLLGEHIVQCQGSMNVNLHGSTTITTSQLRSRDNSCKYCGKKFSPSKIAAHMRACSVRSTKTTYNVWNSSSSSSSLVRHEALNLNHSTSSCSSNSPKGHSQDSDDLYHHQHSLKSTSATATTLGSGGRRDSSSSTSGATTNAKAKIDGMIKIHTESLPLSSTSTTITANKTSTPGTGRNNKKNQKCDSVVSISSIVPIKSGSKISSSSESSQTFLPVSPPSTQDDRNVIAPLQQQQRKRQSSAPVLSESPPSKSKSTSLSLSPRRDSSSGVSARQKTSPSVSISITPPKGTTTTRGRNKVQLQFQQQAEPEVVDTPPVPNPIQTAEEDMDVDTDMEGQLKIDIKENEEENQDEMSSSTETESIIVPKSEVEDVEEEEEEEEEENKLDPLLREEDGDKRLGLLINELSDKLEYFHRIFNEQQLQQRLLKQQQELQQQQPNPEEALNGDAIAIIPPPPMQGLVSYELIVNYSLNGRTDVGMLNDMLLKSSVDCPYCKLVRLIRIDKRQLVIHMLSKHSWDIRVLRTPQMVLKSILDSRTSPSSLLSIKQEDQDNSSVKRETENEPSTPNPFPANPKSDTLDISNETDPGFLTKVSPDQTPAVSVSGKEAGEDRLLLTTETKTAESATIKEEPIESEGSDFSKEFLANSNSTPLADSPLDVGGNLALDLALDSDSDSSISGLTSPKNAPNENVSDLEKRYSKQNDDIDIELTSISKTILKSKTSESVDDTKIQKECNEDKKEMGLEKMEVDNESDTLKEPGNLETSVPHPTITSPPSAVSNQNTKGFEQEMEPLDSSENIKRNELTVAKATCLDADNGSYSVKSESQDEANATTVAVSNENNINNDSVALPSASTSKDDGQSLPSVNGHIKMEVNEGETDSSTLPLQLVSTEGEGQPGDPHLEPEDFPPLDLNWNGFKLALLDKVFRSTNIVYTFTGEKLGEFGEIPCECLICGFIAETQKNLFPHWRRTHRGVAMKCTMCKGRFLFAGALYSHLCLGTSEPLNLKEKEVEDDEGDSEETVGLRYQCSICENQQLPGFFNYMVHLRKDHNKCELCLETLPTQKELEHHMKKHKLNHFCWKCNLSYCAKPNFMTHLFWKHGTESVDCSKCLKKKWPHIYHFCVPPEYFSCDVCGLYFTRPKALIVHKRLHTGEKLRRCPKTSCQERFISKKLLQKHLETVHVKIPPALPQPPPPPPALSPPPEKEEVEEPQQIESTIKCATNVENDGAPANEEAKATTDTLTDGVKAEDKEKPLNGDLELNNPSSLKSDLSERNDETSEGRADIDIDLDLTQPTPKVEGDDSLEPKETGSSALSSEAGDKDKSGSSPKPDQPITDMTDPLPKNGEIHSVDGSEAETQNISDPIVENQLNGEITPMDTDEVEESGDGSVEPLKTPLLLSPSPPNISSEGNDKSDSSCVDPLSFGNYSSLAPIKLTIQTKSITDYESSLENSTNTDVDLTNSNNYNNPPSSLPLPTKKSQKLEIPAAKPFNLAAIQGPNLSEDESDSDDNEVSASRTTAAYAGNTRAEVDSLCTTNHNGNSEPMLGSLFSSPPLKKDDIPSPNSSPRMNLDSIDLNLAMSSETGGNLSTPSLNNSSKTHADAMDIDDTVIRLDMTDSLSAVGVLSGLEMGVATSNLLDSGDKMKNGDDFGSMSPLLPPLDDFDFSVPEIPTFEENHLPEHIIQENALFSIQHEHDYCSPMFNNNVGGKRKSSSPAASFGPGHLFHGHNASKPIGGDTPVSTSNKSVSSSPTKPKKLKVRKPSPKKSSPKKRRRSRSQSSSSSSSSSSSCSSCGSNCSCSSSSSGSSSSSSSGDDSDSEPSANESFESKNSSSKKQKNKKLTKQATKAIPKIKTVPLPPSPSPKKEPVTVKIVNNGKLKIPKPKKEKPPKPPATTRKYKRTKVAKMTLKLGKGGASGGADSLNNEETLKPEPEPEEPYILESDLETDESGSEEVFHKKQLTEMIGSVQLPIDQVWMMGNEKYLLKIVRGIDDLEELRPPPPPSPPTPPPPPPRQPPSKAKKERVKYSVKNGGSTESKLKVRNVPIKPLIVKRNVNSGGKVKSIVTAGNVSVMGEPTFQSSLTSSAKHNTITVSRGLPNAATTPPASSLLKSGGKGGQRGKANHDLVVSALPTSLADDSQSARLSPSGNKRGPRGRKAASAKAEKAVASGGKAGKAAAAAEAYDEKLYCFCQSPHDYVSQMIGCDGKDCQYKWFHFECVGIFIPPKGKWFCSECREARRQKAREKREQNEKQHELLLQEHGG